MGGGMIGKMLRARRRALDLTQAQLAERSGVSLPTIARLEQDRNVLFVTCLKVAAALSCSVVIKGGEITVSHIYEAG